MEIYKPIDRNEALELFNSQGTDFIDFLARANRVRETSKGNSINLCAIINAKSGRCPENCAFCAQSSHYKTDIEIYPLVSADEIVAMSEERAKKGVREFSIVTSGTGISSEKEVDEICMALEKMRKKGLVFRCGSLGILDLKMMKKLKDAGLNKYHHNLETARSHFDKICSTHKYEEDINTVHSAHEAGLRVCSGGIFGMGESFEQRIEMAETLQDLDVESVPMNFLNPIQGTPLEESSALTPMECLKTIAVYRLLLPTKDIYICGGREVNLRDLQPLMFTAGANGLMIGNYLTTSGRDIDSDLQMITDMGLEITKD